MIKELTLLEALKLLKSDVDVYNKQKRDAYIIIETALKDSEKTIDKLSNEIKHLKATDRRNKKKLNDFELLKKCLYVGKSSGAIAITSYGFENYDLLKETLK